MKRGKGSKKSEVCAPALVLLGSREVVQFPTMEKVRHQILFSKINTDSKNNSKNLQSDFI